VKKLKPKNGDTQKKRSGREVRGVSREAGRESMVGKICKRGSDYLILFLLTCWLSYYAPLHGTEWPNMCWCAIKKLLTYSFTSKFRI